MDNALRRFKAEIFQALAHPTRIAIVELLRDGEITAGGLGQRLGIEQSNASQHLGVLRTKWVVVSRKEGNQVYYSIRSTLLFEVLDSMRAYFEDHLLEATDLLQSIQSEAPAAPRAEPGGPE